MRYSVALTPLASLALAACGQMDGETTAVEAPAAGSGAPVATVDAPSEWMTAWGDPDLQGVYTFATNTPLERPDSLEGKESFSAEELEELEAAALARRRSDVHDPDPGQLGAAYNSFWTENETGQLLARTSLITDPENGKLPPLTENGRAILDGWLAGMAERTYGDPPFTQVAYRSWFDLPAYERCVARPMPRIWQAYNHGAQILQTPDHVVLHYESMHDARIIALDDRPPLHADIRFWNGSSRGRFEGDTLVIETTNYAKQWMDAGRSGPPIQFPMDNMRITERFRRLDEDTLSYEVTVEDPTVWTRPWTLEMPWVGDDPNYEFPEHLYEFACHEGNYRAMEDTLRGSYGLR
ncbi:MAG TPA: hypothetical protein VIV64_03585 [Gammaproteobacteria bacterium]